MLPRFIRCCIPSKDALQQSRLIKWLSPWLQYSPEYWKLTNKSVRRGVMIGCFNAFMPIPFQTLIALAMAIPLRANLFLALGLLWINNPLTMVPLYWFAYKTGVLMLNETMQPIDMHLSLAWIQQEFSHIWKPFLLGCTVNGALLGAVGYWPVS